jgi:hypothetical protein
MKKLKLPYLTYFTIILTLLIVLSVESFDSRASSGEHGNQNQLLQEDAVSSYGNKINNTGNEINNTSKANKSETHPEKFQNNLAITNENKISEYKDQRQKINEELQFQKKEYQNAKKDFLKVRNKIRAEELDPNSNESLNATKLYINSSINYMIAHLSNVKSNIEYSNSNGTEHTIVAIDEKIQLFEAKKIEVANASSQKDLAVTVKSLRESWDSAQKISLSGAGQIVSGKIGEFLEKSEALSNTLETKIGNLKEAGVDVSDLRIKLTSYISYIKSAQEKKSDADSIYEDENVTREDVEVANNYLRQSLNDINKANKLLKEIFEELKKYEIEKGQVQGGRQ